MKITVIGAGLAGSEAAWQLAKRGVEVELFEMRPSVGSPAHHTGSMAELVCSNSLRADRLENAAGLLKEELRLLDSLILACADATRLPAGGALAVDREGFSRMVTAKISSMPNITVHREEVTSIPEGVVIIAAGPLCGGALAQEIQKLTGEEQLSFYDAAAPIVTLESLNMDIIYRAGRYGRGESDYLNCPMDREQYMHFIDELLQAETAPVHGFENDKVFEGCMPVEVMASRGVQTLAFGPCKPVGLPDPRTGKEPYAVVQLRQDDGAATLYNIVGFQTHLKFGEQKRVFSLIPGLENAEFARYGVMHRNTFLCSPRLLNHGYQLKREPRIFFAGQITGVEGYIESTASGLVAALAAWAYLSGKELPDFTQETAVGALSHYISSGSGKNFQPMNINFGIMEPVSARVKGGKQAKNLALSQRAITHIKDISERMKKEAADDAI